MVFEGDERGEGRRERREEMWKGHEGVGLDLQTLERYRGSQLQSKLPK